MSRIMDLIEKKINLGQNVLITVVGDSVTYGIYKAAINETYCAVLAQRLGGRFPDTQVVRYDGKMSGGSMPLAGYEEAVVVNKGNKGKITVVKCGVGGDTVRRALNRKEDYIGGFITGETTDIYMLMFGINDSLKDDASKYVSPQKFLEDLTELTSLLNRTNPNAEIVLLTPTYGDDGTSKISCLEPYVENMKILADEKNYMLIDTHELWMKHLVIGGENCGQGDWLADDPWHFAPAGGIATGNYIFEELNK